MATPLFIEALFHDGPNQGTILIPFVDALPVIPMSNRVVILSADVGPSVAGMYVYTDQEWEFAMPIEAVSAIVINGDDTEIYINVVATINLPSNYVVYRNGQLQPNTTIEPGIDLVYSVRIPSAVTAGVDSINGLRGAITLAAGTNMTIVSDGLGTLTFNATGGTPYVLPVATDTVLGGVMVPQTSQIKIDAQGNLTLDPALIATINGKLSTLTSVGAGSSLIDSQGAGNANMRSLVAGSNITISDDGNGGLVVASTGGISNVTLTGDVTGTGTGTVPTTLSPSGVTAGTYTKVTVDAKGRVTVGENPTSLAGYGITDALPLAGGSMTGDITMTTGKTVKGVPDPVDVLDAVNKQTLDAAIAASANGVFWKDSVEVATTGNITLSAPQTIDGVAVIAGDRVLVKNQTDAKENGIYVVAAGAWTRSADAATGAQIHHAAVLILQGTTNGLSQWTNTNDTVPVVGTDAITFGQLRGAANVYTAGAGISISGLSIAIAPTGVTAGTYTKVTVNNLGQVTAGANLNASDVNTALGYTPYNGTTNPNNYISNLTASGDATGTVSSNNLPLTLAASGVTPGTYTKVTVDAKGRVTVGAQLTNAEIVAAIGYTPVNKAGDTMGGALNLAPAVTLASAATVAIGAAAANDVTITGTTAITAFDNIAVGAHRTLTFAGVLTLTHNSGSLILPTGANVTTAAGDTAEFVSLGAGNWRCVWYQRANGQSLAGASDPTKLPLAGGTMSGALNLAPTVTLSSAGTVAIGAAAANDISITGTVTISAFDSIPAGAVRRLTFTGALTLTHNATSLILPTGANVVTAAGDGAQFTSLGGGNWRCDYYQRANGQSLSGGSPYSTRQVFNGSTTEAAALFKNVEEAVNLVAAAPAAVQTLDASSGSLTFFTNNASANWTFNLRFSGSTSLNTAMAVGESLTFVALVTNGASAFFMNALQIDGAAVTPRWAGGVAPAAGFANSVDAYSLTVIKRAAATFTVLASQTQHG